MYQRLESWCLLCHQSCAASTGLLHRGRAHRGQSLHSSRGLSPSRSVRSNGRCQRVDDSYSPSQPLLHSQSGGTGEPRRHRCALRAGCDASGGTARASAPGKGQRRLVVCEDGQLAPVAWAQPCRIISAPVGRARPPPRTTRTAPRSPRGSSRHSAERENLRGPRAAAAIAGRRGGAAVAGAAERVEHDVDRRRGVVHGHAALPRLRQRPQRRARRPRQRHLRRRVARAGRCPDSLRLQLKGQRLRRADAYPYCRGYAPAAATPAPCRPSIVGGEARGSRQRPAGQIRRRCCHVRRRVRPHTQEAGRTHVGVH